jgi:hypothetical protein
MRTRDEQVKRQQEEVSKIRNDFNAINKKEGGNLMTKDFTDEVYEQVKDERNFVPETSEMFTNLLVVVPHVKLQEFRTNHVNLLDNYYNQNDPIEYGRIPDHIGHKFKAMKEQGGDAWQALLE